LNKDIKFICNTFIWDLIVEFYRAPPKKKKLVAIPSIGSFQHYFLDSHKVTRSSRQVSRKENEATYLVAYYNIIL
jgi:hypothetical protein